MAQPIFQLPEATTILCKCGDLHTLGQVPENFAAFALASRLWGEFSCADCTSDSSGLSYTGLELCTIKQYAGGKYLFPLGGCLTCSSCASGTALGNIPSQNQLESILGALAGNYECPECSGREAKPSTSKDLLEWLKQKGCTKAVAKKLVGDLQQSMDALYFPGLNFGLAIVGKEFQDGSAIFSPFLKPKGGGESKRFLLVRPEHESSTALWGLYGALAHAEKAYKTAVVDKSRALEERQIDLQKAKQNLFEALKKFLIPKESEGVEFSIDVSVSEALPEKKEEETKRAREEEEEDIVIDLVSSEEEEIVIKKKLKPIKSRNRISTIIPGRLFLYQYLSTTKLEAKQMSNALQNRGGEVVQHCSKKGVTVLRLPYAMVEYLLVQNAFETERVSPPFDSKQVLIDQKKHSVLVVLNDLEKRIFEAVCADSKLTENQEELLKLIQPSAPTSPFCWEGVNFDSPEFEWFHTPSPERLEFGLDLPPSPERSEFEWFYTHSPESWQTDVVIPDTFLNARFEEL